MRPAVPGNISGTLQVLRICRGGVRGEFANGKPCEKIAGAKEIVLKDGSAAMLVIFTDGDYTWWSAQGAQEIGEVKSRAGETIIISSEDPPEIFDVGTVH
jgi:hypothetical protein